MNQLTPHHQGNVAVLDEDQYQTNGMLAVESSKAVQEVQASLIIAKRFPRDEIMAQRKIMNACQRPGLAEVATYEYSRGGSAITGPSIRLAEAMAQYWGNIDFGWRELDRKVGKSTVQSYCWDKETNTRREMTFDVPHIRDTKQGGKVLKDERDIYENNANMAARRMRACILAMLPGDIVEEAVAQCDLTLKTKIDLTPERRANMLKAFESMGVTKAMIEVRIQRNFDAITPAQFFGLGKIANSIKEGLAKPEDMFDFALVEEKKVADKKPAAVENEKKDLEGFKEKHSEEKKTIAERLEKAETAAAEAKKKPVSSTPVGATNCKTCVGTGVVISIEDGDEVKSPCVDCKGSGNAE